MSNPESHQPEQEESPFIVLPTNIPYLTMRNWLMGAEGPILLTEPIAAHVSYTSFIDKMLEKLAAREAEEEDAKIPPIIDLSHLTADQQKDQAKSLALTYVRLTTEIIKVYYAKYTDQEKVMHTDWHEKVAQSVIAPYRNDKDFLMLAALIADGKIV